LARNLVWIALGGIIGSLLRYGADQLTVLFFNDPNPFAATVFVNMAGCFFMGMAAVARFHSDTTQGIAARLFLMTGLLGSFTTFSGYTIQALELLQSSLILFFLYFFGQVFLGLILLIAGAKISESIQ
jgi:fluoride exporter